MTVLAQVSRKPRLVRQRKCLAIEAWFVRQRKRHARKTTKLLHSHTRVTCTSCRFVSCGALLCVHLRADMLLLCIYVLLACFVIRLTLKLVWMFVCASVCCEVSTDEVNSVFAFFNNYRWLFVVYELVWIYFNVQVWQLRL